MIFGRLQARGQVGGGGETDAGGAAKVTDLGSRHRIPGRGGKNGAWSTRTVIRRGGGTTEGAPKDKQEQCGKKTKNVSRE